MSCETVLNNHLTNLSEETTTLPTPMRVGLLSYQTAIKAMKKAFKKDQSIDAVERLFDVFTTKQSTSDELLACAAKEVQSLSPDAERVRQMQQQQLDFLTRKGFETADQFDQFVDQVFGGFGYMVSLFFKEEANYSTLQAILEDVAKAIGVSRTLRELHEDTEQRFLMIPQETLEQFQVDVFALKGQKITENFAQLINSFIEVARRRYEHFYDQIQAFPRDVRYALYTFVKTQEAILDEIIWNRYDCLNTDLVVSPLRRSFIRFKAKRVISRLAKL